MDSSPEKDLTVKCSLKRFLLHNEVLLLPINDAVHRVNRIITEAYHLLNLHIRRLIEGSMPLPTIDETWLRQFTYAVSTLKGKETGIEDDSIQETYDNCYLPLLHAEFGGEHLQPSRDNLADCINAACTEMLTCIENNIRIHFVKRQMKYLRARYPEKPKKDLWDFLIERNNKSNWNPNEEYLPNHIEVSVLHDLEKTPIKFLVPMYYMNLYLERNGLKSFSLLPTRRGFVPRAIRLTTRDFEKLLPVRNKKKQKEVTLVPDEDIFYSYRNEKLNDYSAKLLHKWVESKGTTIKKSLLKNDLLQAVLKFIKERFSCWDKRPVDPIIQPSKKRTHRQRKSEERMDEDDQIWKPWVDFSRIKSYKKKGYRFSQSIITDGVSVSIPLRIKDYDEYKRTKKRNKQHKKSPSNMSHLKGRAVVGVDPGKHSIVYMTSDCRPKKAQKNRMQISNAERRRAIGTKNLRYMENKHKKKKKDWKVLESELSKVSSKSTTVKAFQDYISIRFKVQHKLYEYYQHRLFRVHRWEKYKREKRFHHYIVEQIKKKFGKDPVLAFGTWNRKTQMKGLIPSPTCGIRKLLSKHFTVIDTPEFNTTKTCSNCICGIMEPCMKRTSSNIKKRMKEPDAKYDVRGLRRCNNEECQVFINRDYNAAINIRNNLNHFIRHGTWHPLFQNSTHVGSSSAFTFKPKPAIDAEVYTTLPLCESL